jgi:hypothetical protein
MNEVLRSMLMNKITVYLGATLAVVLLGVGGVAYRAAGQTAPGRTEVSRQPAQDGRQPSDQDLARQALSQVPRGADSRPLTELELLRREVDILKARVELLEERQRAQESGPRVQRGRAGAPGTAPAWETEPRTPAHKGAVPETPAGTVPGQFSNQPLRSDAPQTAPQVEKGTAEPLPARGQRGGAAADKTTDFTMGPAGASPDEELDAAVKAIREAHDGDARRRAVDALEKALQRLRQENYKRAPANIRRDQ